MVKILREADKTPVAEVAKKHGVAEQTIYIWRPRLGTSSRRGSSSRQPFLVTNRSARRCQARTRHQGLAYSACFSAISSLSSSTSSSTVSSCTTSYNVRQAASRADTA